MYKAAKANYSWIYENDTLKTPASWDTWSYSVKYYKQCAHQSCKINKALKLHFFNIEPFKLLQIHRNILTLSIFIQADPASEITHISTQLCVSQKWLVHGATKLFEQIFWVTVLKHIFQFCRHVFPQLSLLWSWHRALSNMSFQYLTVNAIA